MANNITTFKKYADMLDEVYTVSAKTGVLESASELYKKGANASEIIIPKMSMDGLGNYSRNSGYLEGSVELTMETVPFDYERGRAFMVDAMDDEETAGIAFSSLAGEFIRTKVTPELDAFRIATYAATEGADITAETYSTGEAVYKAIAAKYDAMTEAEVPESDRHLFITPTLKGMIRDMDTYKAKELMDKFASVQEIPQNRFYTAIEQLDGKTSGQTKGGYKKADSGFNLNFLIIHRPAVIQYQKHVAPKVITPELNQDADAFKFGYRNVGIADAYENKAAGIAGTYVGA